MLLLILFVVPVIYMLYKVVWECRYTAHESLSEEVLHPREGEERPNR